MDPSATNYNPDATVDDGSCEYEEIHDCMDPSATNYNPDATVDDGSCEYEEIQVVWIQVQQITIRMQPWMMDCEYAELLTIFYIHPEFNKLFRNY